MSLLAGLSQQGDSIAAHNADAAAHWYGGALSQITGLLKQGSQSVSVLVCTDSTGVGSSNWVRLLASKLAAAAPAYNVRYRYFGSAVDGQNEVWYSVQQLYTAPGGRTHIVFDGSAQSPLPVYPATGAVGTAPFEIQIQVRFSTLAARQKLYCRANSALTNWQYLLEIVATGELIFRYNTADTGTLNAEATSTAKLSTLLQAGEDAILKVSYSGTTTKQVTFAVSKDDGATWVQLGGAVTVTTDPSATANMQWFLGGPTHAFSGRIYGMEQTSGATKRVQLPDEIGKWTVTSGYGPGGTAVTNFSYAGAPTLTIWNGASGGQTYTYFTNAGGAGPQYFVNSGLDCVLMAALHNYSGALGTSFETYAASLPTYARTLCPAAYFVGMTQNPFSTVKDTLNRRYSRTKFSQQVGWCKKNGYPVIDIHSAFLANFTEERIAEITDSSGVHLIAGGEGPDFWAAQVASAF